MSDQSTYDEPTVRVLTAVFQIEELVARIRLRVRGEKAAAEASGADWTTAAALVHARKRLDELAALLDA